MLRLIFPKIDFSGRLSRAGFWRELAASAVWTPVVLGALTYIGHEISTAADSGIVPGNMRAKAVGALMLSLLTLRNSVALLSVFRRRMNDAGYGKRQYLVSFLPILAMLALVIAVAMAHKMGLIASYAGVTPLLGAAVVGIVVWQFYQVMHFAWVLLFGRSQDETAAGSSERLPKVAAANPWADATLGRGVAMSGAANSWREQMNQALQILWTGYSSYQAGEGRSAKRVMDVVNRLQQEGNDSEWLKAVRGALIGCQKQQGETDPLRPGKGSRHPRARQPVKPEHSGKETHLHSTARHGRRPVAEAGYRAPRPGRASFWPELLRGPWG